jgi:hypothetical protein
MSALRRFHARPFRRRAPTTLISPHAISEPGLRRYADDHAKAFTTTLDCGHSRDATLRLLLRREVLTPDQPRFI